MKGWGSAGGNLGLGPARAHPVHELCAARRLAAGGRAPRILALRVEPGIGPQRRLGTDDNAQRYLPSLLVRKAVLNVTHCDR